MSLLCASVYVLSSLFHVDGVMNESSKKCLPPKFSTDYISDRNVCISKLCGNDLKFAHTISLPGSHNFLKLFLKHLRALMEGGRQIKEREE